MDNLILQDDWLQPRVTYSLLPRLRSEGFFPDARLLPIGWPGGLGVDYDFHSSKLILGRTIRGAHEMIPLGEQEASRLQTELIDVLRTLISPDRWSGGTGHLKHFMSHENWLIQVSIYDITVQYASWDDLRNERDIDTALIDGLWDALRESAMNRLEHMLEKIR